MTPKIRHYFKKVSWVTFDTLRAEAEEGDGEQSTLLVQVESKQKRRPMGVGIAGQGHGLTCADTCLHRALWKEGQAFCTHPQAGELLVPTPQWIQLRMKLC